MKAWRTSTARRVLTYLHRGRPPGTPDVKPRQKATRPTPPPGYCTAQEAAARLGQHSSTITRLVREGTLNALPGPKAGRYPVSWIEEASLTAYQPRGRAPRVQEAPQVSTNANAPWDPRQTVSDSNGQGPPAPPRQGHALQPAPAKLWDTLARLEAHKREVWDELRAGASAAIRDEWYLLLRRLLFAELALLEELFEEPEAKQPEAIDYFGDDEEDEDV